MSQNPRRPTQRHTPCGTSEGNVTITMPLGCSHGRLPPAADPMIDRVRQLWAAGDDARIAAGYRSAAEAFVARRALGPTMRILDLACGSGNVAIAAARCGAAVTGLDLVDGLLAAASARAAHEGVSVALHRGTAEALPYPDAAFDTVLSMFGVMFAIRPDRVLAELARVTRPGGQVALASWTSRGFMGRLMGIQAALAPPSPELPDPLQWGEPELMAEWFDPRLWALRVEFRTLVLRYPLTPLGTAELYRAAHGPTIRTFESLGEDRRGSLAADLATHWRRHRRPHRPGTEVEAEFLELVAVRR